MASRFASNLFVLLVGAVLACVSLSMADSVAAWVGLVVGALVVAATLGAFAARGRGTIQRGLDCAIFVLGAWTIVASRAFAPGATVKWLMFAAAAAMVAFAAEALIAHEVALELSLRRAARLAPIQSSTADPRAPMRVAG